MSMAMSVEYQTVYARRSDVIMSIRAQIILALCVLSLLGIKVWMKVSITDVGYQLAKERQKTVTLELSRQEEELGRSVLLRSDHLEAMARKKLGLKPLDPSHARRLRE